MTEVRFPKGHLWPLKMPADMAAACMGENSVESFRNKVKIKVYPPPIEGHGSRQMWRLSDLKECVDGRTYRHSYEEDV